MSKAVGSFLSPPGFLGPSGLRALAREGSAVVEAARLVRHNAEARSTRRETPYTLRTAERRMHPVVLVPGFMAGDYTLSLMARHLRADGHRTYRSGIVLNAGCIQDAGERLEKRVEEIAVRRGQKVALVGHSLGGMISRRLAAQRPDLVSGLVTMGSPVLAPGAVHSALLADLALVLKLSRLGVGGLMSPDCTSGSCAEKSFEESKVPLPQAFPFTAIYSKRDGIVDWRACLDPAAKAVRVATSHVGMALDPHVFAAVTHALAEFEAKAVGRDFRLTAVPESSAG